MAIYEFTHRKIMKNVFAESPNESLGFLLTRVYGLRQKRMNEELDSIGINYVQFNLLSGIYWLQMNGKTISQMMLVDFTKLDKSVVSNILQKMVLEGYVSRKELPSDTRTKIVTLTKQGIELVEQANLIVNKTDETFWGEIPQKEICDSLNKIIEINT